MVARLMSCFLAISASNALSRSSTIRQRLGYGVLLGG